MTSNSYESLRQIAREFYGWQNAQYPVSSSHQGLHTWDGLLTDYSAEALAGRRAHLEEILHQVSSFDTRSWERSEYVDWLLFRAQLEGSYCADRILDSPATDPQIYVRECTHSIFSLIKKDYAPAATRAKAAMERFSRMPELMQQARENLKNPFALYCRLAIASAKAITPLFVDSLAMIAEGLPAVEKREFQKARDNALGAIAEFASWLESRMEVIPDFSPMGEASYGMFLAHVHLLPFEPGEIALIGRCELARFRALEGWLEDPAMADPDPRRNPGMPEDGESYLRIYESRQAEVLKHCAEKRLVTLPSYMGRFMIRELPAAFRPTSPGGFMNPPGLYDPNPDGFYFIPAFNPDSGNFYIRAAIEEPRPILAHEGIPGHFLQLSQSHHLDNEIRKHHHDTIFAEGWALYTEEMLARTGLYPLDSAGHGQVLRLGRYRAARVEADVNLHTGRWTFDETVSHYREGGGLDEEAATGEAAGTAAMPLMKISYTLGKWQIMRLLGIARKMRDFRLGSFHDRLLSFGTLPLSIVEWLLFDDRGTLDQALSMRKPLP